MKKYEQPTLNVVELSVKENITADPVYGAGVEYDATSGITTYNLKLYSETGSEQA